MSTLLVVLHSLLVPSSPFTATRSTQSSSIAELKTIPYLFHRYNYLIVVLVHYCGYLLAAS
jgi:hypothetical protein